MSVLHEEHGSASAGSLQSLPPGLLSPLLKKHRHSADDELKQRLEELESKLYVPSLPSIPSFPSRVLTGTRANAQRARRQGQRQARIRRAALPALAQEDGARIRRARARAHAEEQPAGRARAVPQGGDVRAGQREAQREVDTLPCERVRVYGYARDAPLTNATPFFFLHACRPRAPRLCTSCLVPRARLRSFARGDGGCGCGLA